MLQSVAECCRVLQSVAECCRVLQSVAECCTVAHSVSGAVCVVRAPFVNQCAGAHSVLPCNTTVQQYRLQKCPAKFQTFVGLFAGHIDGVSPSSFSPATSRNKPQQALRKQPSLCTFSATLMEWLQLVGSLKLYVSFAEYSLFYRALL